MLFFRCKCGIISEYREGRIKVGCSPYELTLPRVLLTMSGHGTGTTAAYTRYDADQSETLGEKASSSCSIADDRTASFRGILMDFNVEGRIHAH